MVDFEDICENVKRTLINIMEKRKIGYSRKWMEKFAITLRGA